MYMKNDNTVVVSGHEMKKIVAAHLSNKASIEFRAEDINISIYMPLHEALGIVFIQLGRYMRIPWAVIKAVWQILQEPKKEAIK